MKNKLSCFKFCYWAVINLETMEFVVDYVSDICIDTIFFLFDVNI